MRKHSMFKAREDYLVLVLYSEREKAGILPGVVCVFGGRREKAFFSSLFHSSIILDHNMPQESLKWLAVVYSMFLFTFPGKEEPNAFNGI